MTTILNLPKKQTCGILSNAWGCWSSEPLKKSGIRVLRVPVRKMLKRRIAMFERAIEVLKLAAEHLSSTADHQTNGFIIFLQRGLRETRKIK